MVNITDGCRKVTGERVKHNFVRLNLTSLVISVRHVIVRIIY